MNFAEKAQTLEVRTSDQKLTLEGLACYQNYSIQVVAATKMGDGLKSRSVYCRTKEDCKLLLHYCIIQNIQNHITVVENTKKEVSFLITKLLLILKVDRSNIFEDVQTSFGWKLFFMKV